MVAVTLVTTILPVLVMATGITDDRFLLVVTCPADGVEEARALLAGHHGEEAK